METSLMMKYLPDLSVWDAVLVIVVSIQATVLAKTRDPQWKAIIMTLPVPFTCAALAVQRPVDASNVLGFIVLFIFAHAVRLLHQSARLSILQAIAASVILY